MNEAGYGSTGTAVRPKAALSGAKGAGAAGGRAVSGRSTASSEQTRTACRRTAADSHAAEKSGRGRAGGAGAAGGRVVSGFGRSTAASNNLISGPPVPVTVRSGPGCSAQPQQPGGPHWQPSLFKVPRKRADRMMGSESLASAIMMSSGTPGESVEIAESAPDGLVNRGADTLTRSI